MGMILRKSNENEIEKYEIYKHGNSNLFRRLDKDSIANQSTVSLVIGTICVYFHTNINYYISMKGEYI